MARQASTFRSRQNKPMLGSRPSPTGCRRRTPTATRWRFGCTLPGRRGDRRESCICSTTWPTRRHSYGRHVLKLTPNDVCFSPPKIFFSCGFGNSITFPYSVGATSLLMPGKPEPAPIFAAIAQYRPTVFFGLPTLYTILTKAPEIREADFSSLRLAVSAAEILSPDVFNAWKALTGLEIVECLGSTELLNVYLSNIPEKKRLGAVGVRVPELRT